MTFGWLAADLGSYKGMLRDSKRRNIHPGSIISARSLCSTITGTHFMTYTRGKRVHQYPDTPHLTRSPIIPTYIRLDPPLRTTHFAAVLSSVVGSPRSCCRVDSNDNLFG